MNKAEQSQSRSEPGFVAGLVASHEEREAVFAVRMTVFVEEQAVPAEEELDAYDVGATHFLVRQSGAEPRIVGTARLVDKGDGLGKVGRVAVLAAYRGLGLGVLLMQAVEVEARRQGLTRLLLDAQCYAIGFYEKWGYVAEGDVFLDAGIEHRRMTKTL